MNKKIHNNQLGAVSLFAVIFAMLLLVVVTVSFLRLMMADMRQASDTDLSQSAYDSAQAGVEDGKRALLRYQSVCATNSVSVCDNLATQLSTDTCNEAVRIGGVVPGTSGEVPIQTTSASTNSASFNQAYTCLTMKLDTENFEGILTDGTSKFIPLNSVSNFTHITIKWYNLEDLGSAVTPVNLPTSVSRQLLKDWPANRPPVIRAQLMQYGQNFKLDSFDTINASSEMNAGTLFLYPTSNGSSSDAFVGRDVRASSATDEPDADDATTTPLPTRCQSALSAGGYACSITLQLPTPVGGGSNTERHGYLRLTPFYKGAHFEVSLSDSAGNVVDFKAVQPVVDSTGRANDIFRRIQSRVELTDTALPLPEAAVDVTTEFCKDFMVTNTTMIPGTCTYP